IRACARQDARAARGTRRVGGEFWLPPELISKILQRLAKRRLIGSQNGPKGGYVLTRHPADISVGEVVRALEGPISIVSCLDGGGCPQEMRCNLKRPVQKLQTAISQLLDTMSLAELSNQGVSEVLTIK